MRKFWFAGSRGVGGVKKSNGGVKENKFEVSKSKKKVKKIYRKLIEKMLLRTEKNQKSTLQKVK